MVQRKVQSKLGIKADQIKPGSGSENIKTTTIISTPQHHDRKASRGPDLTRKMKKSRSTNRSNINPLRSSRSGTKVPQPGKPPPVGVQVPNYGALTPQKQPRVKTDESLPNYMKPTSSSDARKERSSVSPPRIQTSSDTKITRRMSSTSSKVGSPSCNNSKTPGKNLKRCSSLRLVRTLTKTPSFKPARSSSAKRCSKVVICANMSAQRATCSSTLKDSKFPKYLTLSPGATEAEGTSAMKVCPYRYCSLNGHHHSPLPPLKCFISSRRSAMKTQRTLKDEALKTDMEKPTSVDGRKSIEADEGRCFFIEVYAKPEYEDIYRQESYPAEEKESEVQEKAHLPISVSGEALPVESLQGKYGSEVECNEGLEEGGSESPDMEWDDHCYSNFELDEAEEQSTLYEDEPRAEKPGVCSNLLFIHWKDIPNENVQQGEDEACPEAQLVGDQVLEISEASQVLDCFSYNQYSSSEEDELEEATSDTEEAAESLTEELSAQQAESMEIDPVFPKHLEKEETENLSFEHELEISSYPTLCLCQEKEETAIAEAKDDIAGEGPKREIQDLPSDEQQYQISNIKRSHDLEMSDEANEEKMKMLAASEDSMVEVDQEVGDKAPSSMTEGAHLQSHGPTIEKTKSKYTRAESKTGQDTDSTKIWITKNTCKSPNEEDEDQRRFNPRDPNYLPIVLDPEAEKVDLRHQLVDERRNSDEWMIDYALRQAVTRLAPARKRKVALLVEAFEKVMPIPKVTLISNWETHLMSPRTIQACS